MTLDALAPHLPADLIEESLHRIQQIGDVLDRIEAQAALCDYLGQERLVQTVEGILATLREVKPSVRSDRLLQRALSLTDAVQDGE